VKASRFLLLCLMATACIPASGVSPAQTAIQNPDPQLTGPSPLSPYVVREATARSASATAPMPAMSKKTKTWLLIGAGVLAAVLLIVLVSGGSSYGGGY
jgi:hypothetical protein